MFPIWRVLLDMLIVNAMILVSVQYYNSDTFLTYRHSANIILNKNKSLLENIQKKLYQINIANTDLVTDFSLHNIKIMRENFTFLKKLFSFFF